jgi:hypothetical protein
MRIVPEDENVGAPETPASSTRLGTFGGTSRKRWADYFSALPAFRCSDPYLESMYWYRWYVLRVNAAGPATAAPNVVSSVRELRWSGDPSGARRMVKEFLQKPSAADWGSALGALDALWPDAQFVREVYPLAVAAAEWLALQRDREGSGLYDLARDDPSLELRAPTARAARIKGVDATVDAYSLLRWLERSAPVAGADGARWQTMADNTKAVVREKMWNGSAGLFTDVDAKKLTQTNVQHARCFLPYTTDMVSDAHIAGLEAQLLNPAKFFTALPVPSLAADDPRFSAEGDSKLRRAADPWNGRCRPDVTAAAIDALARAHAPQLRAAAAVMLRRFVRMMFHDGDLRRVNSHEHYNPLTGHASVYRGADDIEQAWMNDLIIRHLMGIDATDEAVTIDPLPVGLEYAEISGVRVRGRTVDVLIEGQSITATVDSQRTTGAVGTPMVFATPSAG